MQRQSGEEIVTDTVGMTVIDDPGSDVPLTDEQYRKCLEWYDLSFAKRGDGKMIVLMPPTRHHEDDL